MYMWTCLCTCGPVCVRVDLSVYVWTCLCTCGPVCVHVDLSVYMWTCLCTCIDICMYLPTSLLQATGKGLESLDRIVEDKNIQGVYGPLIQLITCHPRYFTAIEVTAGNK